MASLVRAAHYLTRCDPPAGSRVADHGDGGGAVGAGGDGAGAVRGAFATGASREPADRGLATYARIRGASYSPGAQRTGSWLYLPPEAPAGSRESSSWEGCRGHASPQSHSWN